MFSPHTTDPGTGFGMLQVSANGPVLFDVPLSPAGGGVFTPGQATPFVTLPRDGIGGIQYVASGIFAGKVLYASWDAGEVRVLDVDPATGLPIDAGTMLPTLGTTNPRDQRFAYDLGNGPWGLELDPLTGELFVGTWDGNPVNSIIQIGGPGFGGSTTRFVPGRKLLVKQKKTGSQRLQLLAKDPAITAVTPCEVDGDLVVEAVGVGAAIRRFPLDAAFWKPIKARKPEKGCKYRKGPVVATLQVKAGKMLKVVANADDVGIPLATDPRPVRIEVRHGDVRHCFEFGGAKGRHKTDKKLLAKKADPANVCPGDGSPSGAFLD
jgi:hypothetical protein